MAITNTCIRFLVWAKKKGVSFTNTLTLGHLENMAQQEVAEKIYQKNADIFNISIINWNEHFADSFFYALGAKSVDSLDYSSYEKASIIHDLNKPLPESLLNKYSVVIDGGTLEHIFNFPQAIKSCMQCLQVNGHFIGFSPANNLMGHGFFQFSPELFYQIFSSSNGFKIIGMFIVAADFSVDTENWYEVKNPEEIKERVTLRNELPSYLMILAQKIDENKIAENIIQSDYANLWKNNYDTKTNDSSPKSFFKKLFDKIFPSPLEQNLEKINPRFFKRRKPE